MKLLDWTVCWGSEAVSLCFKEFADGELGMCEVVERWQ